METELRHRIDTPVFKTVLAFFTCGVRGHEVERRPCNHEVPGAGFNFGNFSLAHTFGASTGVVPRKQNRERLV